MGFFIMTENLNSQDAIIALIKQMEATHLGNPSLYHPVQLRLVG